LALGVGELGDRDLALGLESNVDGHVVLRDQDDRPLDDLALLQDVAPSFLERGFEELGKALTRLNRCFHAHERNFFLILRKSVWVPLVNSMRRTHGERCVVGISEYRSGPWALQGKGDASRMIPSSLATPRRSLVALHRMAL